MTRIFGLVARVMDDPSSSSIFTPAWTDSVLEKVSNILFKLNIFKAEISVFDKYWTYVLLQLTFSILRQDSLNRVSI